MGDLTMTVVGTPSFMAPEMLRKEAADHRCDLWSYGCVVTCISTRREHPYEPLSPTDAVKQACGRRPPARTHAPRPSPRPRAPACHRLCTTPVPRRWQVADLVLQPLYPRNCPLAAIIDMTSSLSS